MGKLEITILGSGTSQGVPMIACDCEVCKSVNPKDKRLRSSILISHSGKNYVIDSGPDFRQQMLRENVTSLDAIIFTHEHKDHIAGLDDVRAFNFKQQRDMPVYCTENVERAIRNEFHYIFLENSYPGIPKIDLNRITQNVTFQLDDLEFIPVEVMHYKMPVLGFRIGDFAYITDAKSISDEELNKLKGVKTLIVNALRREEHISHFNLREALEFISHVNPEQAFLTHISHLFGQHKDIIAELPDRISVAYDGMKIVV